MKETRQSFGLIGALCALVIFALSVNGFTQSDNAQISGFVKDATGAVVAGAKVVIKSQARGFERSTVTNGQGYYVVPDLSPDIYSVTVEHAGFKRAALTDKKLDPSIATTVDITLQVGEVNEVVSVEASTASVQTETATLGRLVDRQQIDLTELNGRNPLFLALTKAGVVGGLLSGNNFGLTTGGFNINGGRGQNNMIFFDGAVGVRTRSNATFSIGTADLDSTQEVQILTSNYNAEYGRSSGGQVRIISKGGTKDFHGKFYEYFRNPVLNANTWNRKANPTTRSCAQFPADQQCRPSQFRYNQFGYNLGGPIIIPGTSFNQERKKLFWSFGQEWVRLRQDSLQTLKVPTAKMRIGDFSELAVPNQFLTGTVFLRDPNKSGNCNSTDRTACFNDGGIINKIPAGTLSPQGMALLNAYPAPIPGFTGTGGVNWQDVRPNPTNQLKNTLVIDYNPAEKHHIHGSAQLFRNKSFTPFPFGNEPGYAPRIFNLPNRWISLNHVWTISPKWINEALVTASKDRVEILVDTSTDRFKRSKYGISYPYFFSDPKEIQDKIPTVDFPAGTWGSLNGGPYPSHSSGPIYQFADNMTHVFGNHTIKFGALFERSGQNDFDQINVSGTPGGTNNQNGRFVFVNGTAGGTGNAIGNAAIGLFDTYAEIGQRSYTPYRSHMYEFFVQDSWKVTERLRLELGLRDSIIIPYWSLWRNMVVFDSRFYDGSHVVTQDPVTGLITGGDLKAQYNGLVIPGSGWSDAAKQNCRVRIACTGQFDFLFRGVPKQYSDIHNTDLQPRVGIAYGLGNKSVLRGGIGRFVDRWGVSDSVFLGGNPPLQPTVSIVAGSVDNPGGKAGNAFPQQITSQAKNFPNPEAWQWNGTYEREIGFGTVMSLSYVGRRGLHLQRERNVNQLPTGTCPLNLTSGSNQCPLIPGDSQGRRFNTDALRPFKGLQIVRVTDNEATSFYNGLQIEANRRFTKGLAFGAAYTFSKSSDNGSAQRDIIPDAFDPKVNKTLWGPSTFDRRHVIAFSVIYDLPFFENHSTLMGKILGGWRINEVSQFRTGIPFSVTTGDDFAGVGQGSGNQYWVVNGTVQQVGQFTPPGTDPTLTSWIPLTKPGASHACGTLVPASGGNPAIQPFTDPAACYFTKPAPGTFNTAQVRSMFYNPGDQNHNLAFFKDIAIGERQSLQFRAEAFNWLNHPNWNDVASTNPTSSNFGKVNNKSGERQVQFALRYQF